MRPFCHPLFCHSGVVKYTSPSYSGEGVTKIDYQILLKSPPLTELAEHDLVANRKYKGGAFIERQKFTSTYEWGSPMGVGRIFPGRGQWRIFQDSQKDFGRGGQKWQSFILTIRNKENNLFLLII